MIHVHVDSYDSKDRPILIRLELDNEMRPLVLRVLEMLADKLQLEVEQM